MNNNKGAFMTRRKTTDEFLAQISGRGFEILDDYIDNQTPIGFFCLWCNHAWKARPGNILNKKSGCPECAKKASAYKRTKKDFILADNGTWLLIDIGTPKHPDAKMKIDSDDYDAIRELTHCGFYPYQSKSHSYPYAQTTVNGKTTDVHRLIIKDAKVVDHINHDGLDNRRKNLRGCTHSQNNMNRLEKNSKSGKIGVDQTKWGWRARIKVDGNERHLGYFKDLQDAIRVRKDAEKKYFGEYSCAVKQK